MRHNMVQVLGGYQTDFAVNWHRAGRGYDSVVAEVVEGALAAARIGPELVEVIHVGNAFGQIFTGQGQLGGMPATVIPELWGVPSSRHEAARTNPAAQTRDWAFTPAAFTADGEHNPPVSGRLRRQDCSQMTDGAAAVVLVSERFSPETSTPRAVITGWGHRTVGLPLDQKLRASARDRYVVPHVRQTVADALGRAGLRDIDQIDGVEVHDCFSMSEYLAIDHLGITEPGESWKAVENGDLERTGRLPVDPAAA